MSLNIANIVIGRDYHDGNNNDIAIEVTGTPVGLQISFDSGTTWNNMNQDGTGLWNGSQYWMASSTFNWNTTNTTGFSGDVWFRESGSPTVIQKYKFKGYVYAAGGILDGVTFIVKQNGSTNVDLIVQTQAGATGGNNNSVTLNGATATYQSAGASPVCQWKFTNVAPANTSYSFVQGGQTVAITFDSAVFTAGGGGSTGSLTMTIPTGGTLVVTTQPLHGTLSIVNQTITYTPTAGYSGADSFSYDIKGASGDVISSGTSALNTSAPSTTDTPSFPKSFVDTTSDIRVNCMAGSAVSLFKNAGTTAIASVTDSTNQGYVLFGGIVRVQGDTFKATAQKTNLGVSAQSIICTTKRKPTAITGVTKTAPANGSVDIPLADLVADYANGSFF
ncbi:hypothetical protein LV89_01842 [Arcicella aurantiaca]|uniref:Uncharacterized protein n=1 Tax=Arcicella aurantiaca TaxID=591202 RepID=A0A316E952_9BACT|nr:Ig-like domain-containing protein [Arcicella aurantiaca]PWK27030.1 hypothetical protein LV89_01842 [Arcicella aurantiaca]